MKTYQTFFEEYQEIAPGVWRDVEDIQPPIPKEWAVVRFEPATGAITYCDINAGYDINGNLIGIKTMIERCTRDGDSRVVKISEDVYLIDEFNDPGKTARVLIVNLNDSTFVLADFLNVTYKTKFRNRFVSSDPTVLKTFLGVHWDAWKQFCDYAHQLLP